MTEPAAYVVERRPRRRRLAIHVDPDNTVRVLAPPRVPAAEIAELVVAEQGWIRRQQASHDAVRREHPPPRLEPGGTCPFAGVDWPVRFAPGRQVRLVDGHLELPDRLLASPLTAARAVLNWYRAEARRRLAARVAVVAPQLGVTPGRIRVKDMRSRWGSCSRSGDLSFNLRLMLAPPPALDYVVVHELAHLREPNHGPGFWALVRAICPDCQRHRAWLRRHGAFLPLPDGRQ